MSTAQDNLDPAVVAALYGEHVEELRALLTGVLRDRELVAEALQSTFVRVVEDGHVSREETRKGWLFTVAMNEALQLKRRLRRHSESTRKLASGAVTTSEAETAPEQASQQRETVEKVRRGLEMLPENQRSIVRMRIYDGLTFAAIAERLEMPLGTVLTRMRAALGRLEAVLKSEGPQD